jgi:hypothetical protein
MTEWKTIPNLSRYAFGSNGDIRNVRDENMLHVNGQARTNNQCNLKDDDGKIVRKTIHRVIMELFGEQPFKPTTLIVRKDGNEYNNAISNLAYAGTLQGYSDEIWKTVPDYPLYEASNKGNLRNVRLGKSFAGSKGLQGYLTTAFEKTRVTVHVIVAKTFIPNPENKPHVTHLNDVYTDNRVENLAWMTSSEIKALKSKLPVKKPAPPQATTSVEPAPQSSSEASSSTVTEPKVVTRGGNIPILMMDIASRAVIQRFSDSRRAMEWVFANVDRIEAPKDEVERRSNVFREKMRVTSSFVDYGYLWEDEPVAPMVPTPVNELRNELIVPTAPKKGTKPILMMYSDTQIVAQRFESSRLAAEWLYRNVYKREGSADDIRRETDSMRDKFRINRTFIYQGYLWKEENGDQPVAEKPKEKHKKEVESEEVPQKKPRKENHLNGRPIVKMDAERNVVETFTSARTAAIWMFQQDHGKEPDDYELERASENLRENIHRNTSVMRNGFLWEFKPAPVEILPDEDWKAIDAEYSVSSLGRLKTPKGIKDEFNSDNGYAIVYVGDHALKRVHRLVAEAFHPNPEGKADVNHINGNKLDNRATNLEWTTHQENMAHATATDLKKKMPVAQVDAQGNEIARFASTGDAAKKLGLTKTCVFNVCSGRSKQTGGLYFKYV